MYPAKRLKILPRSFVNYAVTNAAEKENIDYIPVALGRTPPFAYRCQRMCRIGNQTVPEMDKACFVYEDVCTFLARYRGKH